jgi:hypothetical protein
MQLHIYGCPDRISLKAFLKKCIGTVDFKQRSFPEMLKKKTMMRYIDVFLKIRACQKS